MKNKHLFFTLIFSLFLLTFFVFPQTILAADLEVKTGTPAVGLTTTNATGTMLNVGDLGGDITAGGAGFVYGTASAVNGAYNVGTSSDFTTSFATGTDIALTLSGLSKGTLYYYRAYATSNDASSNQQNAYGAEVTFLTGADEPSGLSAESGPEKIKITWTAGSGAGKTMVRYNDGTNYPTAITDGNQAFLDSGTEITIYNLPHEHTYFFSLWSSTTDAADQGLSTTSDTYVTIKSATTAVSSGGYSRTAPTTYSASLVSNGGAAATESREVTLTLRAGNASLMSIANDNLFLVPLETYSTTKTWTLPEGDGEKTVYVKFVSSDGLNSEAVSGTINLAVPAPAVEEPAVTEEPVAEPVVEEPVAEEPAKEKEVEKPISEMTAEELNAKIAEILNQVKNLQNQLSGLEETGGIEDCNVDSFDRSLELGSTGEDVKCLQVVLNLSSDTRVAGSGAGSPGNETAYFGDLTKGAVVKFQEKYQGDVLAPWGLTSGTGFVGSTTRDKLNEILSAQ